MGVLKIKVGDEFVEIPRVADHGQLLGLNDDDHTQYLKADGTRTLTGNWNAGSYRITSAGFTSSENIYIDSTDKMLGINTASPLAHLEVRGDTGALINIIRDGGAANFVFKSFGGGRNNFNARKAAGSEASPTAITNGTTIFRMGGSGTYDTSGTFPANTGRLDIIATENWGVGSYGTKMQFDTTPNGSTTIAEAAEFADDGGIFFARLLGGAIGANPQVWYNTTTKEIGYDTSAQRYKKNVRDLTDTSWIYNLRPVLFDEKDGDRTDMMGLIAEEVVEVKPELVFHKAGRKVIDVKEEDDEGKLITIKREVDDLDNIQIEGVAYSALIPALLKEIQNLKGRIEELEK